MSTKLNKEYCDQICELCGGEEFTVLLPIDPTPPGIMVSIKCDRCGHEKTITFDSSQKLGEAVINIPDCFQERRNRRRIKALEGGD